ncbi:MAG: hypothetical protein DMF96_12555 [Acidobacteria bacterium]|nr:MAG: hypothetical protein DMF96_12555 [Acidobacteriota bacterium]
MAQDSTARHRTGSSLAERCGGSRRVWFGAWVPREGGANRWPSSCCARGAASSGGRQRAAAPAAEKTGAGRRGSGRDVHAPAGTAGRRPGVSRGVAIRGERGLRP